MSMSFVGIANRSFICGRSECPPARSFAPSSAWSAAIAASTESTRSYSNAAGIMPHAPFASWIALQTRSGDAGFSIAVTPRCETASITALITAGGAAIVPGLPDALHAERVRGRGRLVGAVGRDRGISTAVGTRYCVIVEVVRFPDSS